MLLRILVELPAYLRAASVKPHNLSSTYLSDTNNQLYSQIKVIFIYRLLPLTSWTCIIEVKINTKQRV